MIQKTIFAILFFVLAASAVSGGEVREVTVSIDLGSRGVPFSRDLLGVNVDAEDANEPNYALRRYYDSLGPLNTPVVRYPGGLVANYFHWSQTLGPADKRTKQWNWDHTRQFAPHLGAGEFLKLLDRLGARGMIILNLRDGSPEEAGAWVAFCRGRIGDARSIGTDAAGTDWKTVGYWAQRRYEETGLREPANVVYWELGNELIDQIVFQTGKDYCVKARAYAEMARRLDPNALIGWLDWDREVMAGRTNLIDFLIVHNYTGWPRYGDKHVIWKAETLTGEFQCEKDGEYRIELKLAGMGITEPVVQAGMVPRVAVTIDEKELERLTLESQYKNLSYTRRLESGRHRIGITFLNDYCEKGQDTNVDVGKIFTVTGGGERKEYVFPDKESDFREDLHGVRVMLEGVAERCRDKIDPRVFIALTEYNRMECACFDLRTALYTAELQNILLQIPTVRTATIWEACSWNFGIMNCSNGVRRPVYYVLKMMRTLQDRLVPAVVTPDDKDIRIVATKDSMGDGVSILVINLGAAETKIRFRFPKGIRMEGQKELFITGDDLSANNEDKKGRIVLQEQEWKRSWSEAMTASVPGYSVTVFQGRMDADAAASCVP